MTKDAFKWVQKKPYYSIAAIRAGDRARRVVDYKNGLEHLPAHWSRYVAGEFERRGGVDDDSAFEWFGKLASEARGRVKLSASDEDLRAMAKEASGDCRAMAEFARTVEDGAMMMARLCARWGIDPPKGLGEKSESLIRGNTLSKNAEKSDCKADETEKFSLFELGVIKKSSECGADVLPAVRRMTCARWWLRRLRRAHGRRCDGVAIRAGIVRKGLWPYATQDAVDRRGEQRRRNQRAIDGALVACESTGEALKLADVVAGSIANPEVKRSELMVRIKGCDAIAGQDGLSCEFWTLTAPSRFHAFRHVTKKRVEPNPNYKQHTPKEAQEYLSRVWARARAAWKRRGLEVYGLRTAEPHHDGCPHWHLIAYGSARDVRFARRLLRIYALRESPDEPGARKHRFVVLKAKKGRYGAAYAAKYISKNINGEGMGKAGDGQAGIKVSESVRRVDTWASQWGIRQFQFFGCQKISIWRTLRRLRGPVAVVGSMLERARSAADDADFAEFWRASLRGGLELIYRASDCLTAYGDAAAARIAGVREGARRALLPVKEWVIHWRGGTTSGDGVGVDFDLPRSCVNNCTRAEYDWWSEAVDAVASIDFANDFAMAQ